MRVVPQHQVSAGPGQFLGQLHLGRLRFQLVFQPPMDRDDHHISLPAGSLDHLQRFRDIRIHPSRDQVQCQEGNLQAIYLIDRCPRFYSQ